MKPTSGSPEKNAVTAADLAEVDAIMQQIGNPFSASKFQPTSPPSAEKRAIARKGKGLFFAAEDEDAVEARRAAEAERKLLPLSRNKLAAAKDALNDLASVDPSELGSLDTQEYVKRRCRDCIFLLRRKQVPLLTGTAVDEPPRTPRHVGGKPYGAGKPVWAHHNVKRCESDDREGSDEEDEEGDDIPLLSPTTPDLLRAGTHTPLTPR